MRRHWSTRSTVPFSAMHHAGAQRVAAGARVLERERDVEAVRADEPARRAAQQHGLQVALDAAGQVERLAAA